MTCTDCRRPRHALKGQSVRRAPRGDHPVSAEPKPTIPEVLPLVRAYYEKPENGVGGSLHIVLDDDNVDDGDVLFCLEYARERNDADGAALASLLLRMSRTQRRKLAALK